MNARLAPGLRLEGAERAAELIRRTPGREDRKVMLACLFKDLAALRDELGLIAPGLRARFLSLQKQVRALRARDGAPIELDEDPGEDGPRDGLNTAPDEAENLPLASFRRHKRTLRKLLAEAGVPAQDAESLLCDALTGMSPEGHAEGVELELLIRVDRVCAEYAAARGKSYSGLRFQRVRDRPLAAPHPTNKRKRLKNRRR